MFGHTMRTSEGLGIALTCLLGTVMPCLSMHDAGQHPSLISQRQQPICEWESQAAGSLAFACGTPSLLPKQVRSSSLAHQRRHPFLVGGRQHAGGSVQIRMEDKKSENKVSNVFSEWRKRAEAARTALLSDPGAASMSDAVMHEILCLSKINERKDCVFWVYVCLHVCVCVLK
jgi:hypothetical protein